MNIERDKAIKLLESKIDAIVKNVLREKEDKAVKSKRGDDNVEKNNAFKRQYKAIEKSLSDKRVDATGVMSAALGIDLSKDDAARSHAFKKLHKEKTQDGTGNYEFNPAEVAKIFNQLP